MSLSDKTCIPCSEGVPPLSRAQFEPLLAELSGWEVVNDKRLHKTYKFENFADAMALANKIGNLAEEVGHHPDLLVSWGELVIDLWTHRIDALSESDFILAAKIDRLSD